MQSIANHLWAIVPAAGLGKRMGMELPKQYLKLAGKAVIDHTIDILLEDSRIDKVLVGTGEADTEWSQTLSSSHQRVFRFNGGEERTNTVLNGINTALSELNGRLDDRVLVHDAVRPCLRPQDLDSLINACVKPDCGAILGAPLVDTVKRVDGHQRITGTENREELWRALTPQVFQLGTLKKALESGLQCGANCTDEAQAMELAGYSVLVVEGDPSNIKITRPADLDLAALYLRT